MRYLYTILMLAAAVAQGKDCALEIAGNDMMKFDQTELRVDSSCTRVKLTLQHSGQLPKAAMGHNWVLTKAADKAATVAAGVTAGPQHGYLQKDDPRIIAATDMIGGKEQTSVTFPTSKLKVGEKYVFFCTFPGHVGLMTGDFIFAAPDEGTAKTAGTTQKAMQPANKAKAATTATPSSATSVQK